MGGIFKHIISLWKTQQPYSVKDSQVVQETPIIPINFMEDISSPLADFPQDSSNIYESLMAPEIHPQAGTYHETLYTESTSHLFEENRIVTSSNIIEEESLVLLPQIEGMDKSDIMFDMLMSDMSL